VKVRHQHDAPLSLELNSEPGTAPPILGHRANAELRFIA
jgi:hypothetical protein